MSGNALRGATITNAAALGLITVAWWGASAGVRVGQQLGWAAVAVSGLLVAGTANAGFLLAARRTLRQRSRQFVPDAVNNVAPTAEDTSRPCDTPVASPSMTRYHRPSCPLVRGKEVHPATRSVEARMACGICRP
jgi:hypothetical protein